MPNLRSIKTTTKATCSTSSTLKMNGISVGLHGSSAWESAEVDMVVDCVDDLIRPVMTMEYTKNEDEKVRHTGTGPCTIS